MKPHVSHHNPDPDYLRELLARANVTQQEAAAAIGVSPRAMRSYLSQTKASRKEAPYVVQFALEALAGTRPRT
jgi:predicted transcriptional regulator